MHKVFKYNLSGQIICLGVINLHGRYTRTNESPMYTDDNVSGYTLTCRYKLKDSFSESCMCECQEKGAN
jgi:hypothetical protein